jgi:hypothetical protein
MICEVFTAVDACSAWVIILPLWYFGARKYAVVSFNVRTLM